MDNNSQDDKKWKLLNRSTIYSTEFLQVFEDKLELPNGNIHDNYSLVKFPDIIIIVATDINNNVITITEYKYGPDEFFREFPAGHMESNEDPINAAKRELLEETGYGDGDFRFVGKTWEFPTKNLGKAFVVRAKNVKKISDQNLDRDEEVELKIINIQTLRNEVNEKKWIDAKALAAILLTDILNS